MVEDDRPQERRQFDRLERDDEVRIKEYTFPERQGSLPARILDISGGGLQLETDRFFSEGTLLKIEMRFTGWQRFTRGFLKHFGQAAHQPLVVLAEVLRCKGVVPGARYEVGVAFSGIDAAQQEALIRYIRDKLGEPGGAE
ncbi:MAG: PilZ domain-containing protein [Deltaproteobacteria bacterium]|nr:PilZ domain-containing protein [Deltaproteobacteria bacterium]